MSRNALEPTPLWDILNAKKRGTVAPPPKSSPSMQKWDHMLDAYKYSQSELDAIERAPPQRPWNVYEKLKMRLNLLPDDNFGVDHCNIVECPNKVFIFVVIGDNADILEDDRSLFPSDALVAKFQLIRSSK